MTYLFGFRLAFVLLAQTSAFQTPQVASRRTTQLPVTVLEDWTLTTNGNVVGKIRGDPNYNDGDVVTTSPLTNPSGAEAASFVTSLSGSEYLLGSPRSEQYAAAAQPDNAEEPNDITRAKLLQGAGAAGLGALGAVVGVFINNAGAGSGGDVSVPNSPPVVSSSAPATMATTGQSQAWTKVSPGAYSEPTATLLTSREVSDLFGLWNTALESGNPDAVAMRYAKNAVLLPTKSDIPRTDYSGIRDYFVHFQEKKPSGKILESYIQSQPNYAMDVGIYEFSFENGQKIRARYSFLYTNEDGDWKIKHHHSSGMPETPGQVISEGEVKALFTLWNDALLTGNSDAVAKRYAKGAVLLPTVSDTPRTTYALIKDYFDHFLEVKPDGKIIESYVSIGENWCKDVGIYEFQKGIDGTSVRARYSFVYVFEDGEWKISHHHSSLMPEELLAKASKA